ncbi:MAG: XdhC family protein [Microcoleaceae cyanobacterium]
MQELQKIVAAWRTLKPDEMVALATVVQVRGSTYRRPGARMLVRSTGERIGMISGGCLENEVSLQALEVIATNQPVLVSYDAIANEALLWGLGLGCNGAVEILIQPLQPQIWNPVAGIAQCLQQRQSGVLVTAIQTTGETKVQLGGSLLWSSGTIDHDFSNSELIEQIEMDLVELSRSKKSGHTQTYKLIRGQVTVLVETIKPPTPLILFGAGEDAIPVAQFAHSLGWQVTVVDQRQDYAAPERFPMADRIIAASAERGFDQINLDEQTVSVVMTHNYWEDREWLQRLLPSPVAYLGILGPRHRTEHLLQDLAQEGFTPTPEHLERFHSPIGLDIGGDSPEAIALAIVAEIQAVLSQRSGSFLRTRKGAIH